MLRLPDFIIAGAPKTGSSSLINYLGLSPKISCVTTLSNGSEPHFFSNRYNNGIDWYANLFNNLPKGNLMGEKSVSYLHYKEAPKRIKKWCPNVKLIFLLRNPVDRAYSQYKANIQKGTEIFSFEHAVKYEKFRLKFFKNNYSYVSRGLYAKQLKPFMELFPRENILFLLTEELKQEPINSITKIYEFLDIDILENEIEFSSENHNVSRVPKFPILQLPFMVYRKTIGNKLRIKSLNKLVYSLEQAGLTSKKFRPISPKLREYLLDYYKPFNENLSSLANLDLQLWNK